ncbi:MAG: chalcone isomerase family protein [Desulfobacterales bacterium]|jgi:hypothetical protein
MNTFWIKNQIVVLIVVIFLPLGVQAAEINGTNFSETHTVDNTVLKLTGVGLLRYWGFKAYVGAFYLEEGIEAKDALSDSAKRIEIEYLRPIRGEDFGPATDKMVAKNVDLQTYERLRPKFAHYNSLYEGVRPGDRYALTYVPGRGTELTLNGQPKGVIEGEDFAKALFSIWLGPEPINRSFKDQLLGQKES